MKRVIALLLALALSGASAMVLAQDDGYIAVVCVEDEISEYAYGYDHLSTLQMINALMEDPDNHGIFLYLNSPGGYLYESDELYEKLMRYKAQTCNGVYCYVGAQACSGAFYAAMAADYIAPQARCPRWATWAFIWKRSATTGCMRSWASSITC